MANLERRLCFFEESWRTLWSYAPRTSGRPKPATPEQLRSLTPYALRSLTPSHRGVSNRTD